MWISEDGQKLKVEELKIQNTGGAGTEHLLSPWCPSALRSFWNSLSPVTCSLSPVSGLCLLLAAYCLLPPAYCLYAASGLYEVREIKPNVFVWVPDDVLDVETDPWFSRAATAGFIVTAEGVVVVDTANSPFHARELLYEIRRRTDVPVRYVINTSAAGDHMLGNEVFVDQQATLISSSTAQAEMRQYRRELARRLDEEDGWRLQARMRGFHVTPTTQTFEGALTLRLGGQEIRLLSLFNSQQPGEEAAVYAPGAKVLFLGELYQNGYFPRVGSRDVRRWIETLRQVEGWDVDTYVPGHGAPGGKKELGEFRGFLKWLVAQVENRVREGKSLLQIEKELQLPDTFHWHAPDLVPEAVQAVYRQLRDTPPVKAGIPTPGAQDALPAQPPTPQ